MNSRTIKILIKVMFVLLTIGSAGAGEEPYAVAVNPVTNKIYVANYGSQSVTIIDDDSNVTATVKGGDSPIAVAVNCCGLRDEIFRIVLFGQNDGVHVASLNQ